MPYSHFSHEHRRLRGARRRRQALGRGRHIVFDGALQVQPPRHGVPEQIPFGKNTHGRTAAVHHHDGTDIALPHALQGITQAFPRRANQRHPAHQFAQGGIHRLPPGGLLGVKGLQLRIRLLQQRAYTTVAKGLKRRAAARQFFNRVNVRFVAETVFDGRIDVPGRTPADHRSKREAFAARVFDGISAQRIAIDLGTAYQAALDDIERGRDAVLRCGDPPAFGKIGQLEPTRQKHQGLPVHPVEWRMSTQ